jgi:hypothetical protein
LKRILATVSIGTYVTKVLAGRRGFGAVPALCVLMCATAYAAQAGPAETLYLQLSGVGLDPARVFRVRDSSIDRPALHISLEDGTIAFTQDVQGRITGAFFEGDGEVLLIPPNEVERKAMSIFTGMAILEERFSTAYFRFNDNTAVELQPGLRAPDDAQEFVTQWNETARNLAQVDAMRLLETFCDMLPVGDGSAKAATLSNPSDRLLHVRIQGKTLGVFDVLYDSTAAEQVEAGQAKTAENGAVYYDVWASFSTEKTGAARSSARELQTLPPEPEPHEDPIFPRNYVIDARVDPPKQLEAEVKLDLDVRHDGSRLLLFELSRYLKLQTVEADKHAVEFIQNPAIEGTRLARSGNDLVAVILPEQVHKGQKISLRFVYAGEVLAEAGRGLLYVGERGTWYPNRGLAMSNFDLTFHYPAGWTLVATGKPTPISPASRAVDAHASADAEQVSRWVSERPVPVAGFDLGKYGRVTAQAGDVAVETYATGGVERNFPSTATAEPVPMKPGGQVLPPMVTGLAPSPAGNAASVSDLAARAVRYYAERFGPYPYSKLALTQVPGRESQGWPGLIFLSSYAFLTPDERRELHMNPSLELVDQQVPAHEAAHQWWGDLIVWKTYRDQWFSEGLASYCALMMLEERNPEGVRQVLDRYRHDLLEKDKNGNLPKDAGPVTLGSRLLSSHFPEGYEAISYGRAAWLFHMLRTMLQDGARSDVHPSNEQEPFVRALRKVRDRYEGKDISTRELLDVFAEDLPPSLRYQGKASLAWFLDGWVNGTSIPKLTLQGVKYTEKSKDVIASGVIKQEDADVNLITSVPVYAVTSGKTPIFVGRVFADGAETPFHLTVPANTHKLVLDPYETILRMAK